MSEPVSAASIAYDLDAVEEIVAQLVALGVGQKAVEPIRDWVRDRRNGKPDIVVYFGCWDRVGHGLHLPGGRRPDRDDPILGLNNAGPFKRLDGTLTPRETTKQSAAAIHHRDGWTALAMHDYTVDHRGASNSAFVMDSDLSFEHAYAHALQAFPGVMKRIYDAAPIRLVQTEGARDV
jgi:hypothetical protein